MRSSLICGAQAMATASAASSDVVGAADEDVLDLCREAYSRATGVNFSYSRLSRIHCRAGSRRDAGAHNWFSDQSSTSSVTAT